MGVEKIIRENVFPHLFFGNTKTLSPIVGYLSMMPIKMDRLGLLNPERPAKEKYLSSQQGSVELIRVLMGGEALSNANHLWTLEEERRDG